jgi:hypothetical protein
MPTIIEQRITDYVAALQAIAPEGYTYEYVPNPRGRYARVTMKTGPQGQVSVHAFIEPDTGNVFKPAGWKAPAKGVRYALADDKSFQGLLDALKSTHAWAGGYLYVRRLI